jgi:hypothetical protein
VDFHRKVRYLFHVLRRLIEKSTNTAPEPVELPQQMDTKRIPNALQTDEMAENSEINGADGFEDISFESGRGAAAKRT